MRARMLAALAAALGAAALSLGVEAEVVAACGRILAEAARFGSNWWFRG